MTFILKKYILFLLNRNNLTKTCATLKTLIEELIKYFIVCEEEINNTLFTEITKKQLSDSVNNEKIMQLEGATDETEGLKCKELKMSSKKDTLNLSEMIVRKVHFAPKTTEIISIINSNVETLPTILEEDDNITEKLKQELNNCILRLKSESAEILNTSSIEEKLSSKDFWLNKMNEELNLKLHHAETLIMGYQEEIDHQKMTIFDLQRKLVNAENKKETITEGYGENYDVGIDTTLQDFSQLQEKGMKNKIIFQYIFLYLYFIF